MADLPKILKHCTVAIYSGGSIKATDSRDRFQQAFLMARASLTKYGYLSSGSATGSVEKIHLTAKGVLRESKHSRERGGYGKTMMFDRLYQMIEMQTEPPAKPLQKGVNKAAKPAKVKGQVIKLSNRKLPFR